MAQGAASAEDVATGIHLVRGGTLRSLVVWVDAAPGASQTVVFTVMKGGVATALTVTVSGTGQGGTDLVNTVTVAAGDRLALRLVTSGGAAAVRPIGRCEIQYA